MIPLCRRGRGFKDSSVKNQYFGDINDYLKYGLVRLLTGRSRLSTAVCWMLTPDDGRSDGQRISYLYYPLLWGHYDPELYNSLREIITHKNVRTVYQAENAGIVPGACCFADYIPDDALQRAEYFKSFMNISQCFDLIFFDPDNGIEVKSKPLGNKGSSKYLYWKEITASFFTGHSVLIYQHFPRIQRDLFIERTALLLAKRTGVSAVYSFRTAYVVFFLAPWHNHDDYVAAAAASVESVWDRHFTTKKHVFNNNHFFSEELYC